MKVLITGATGLIGRKLSKKVLSGGHELIVVGRDENEVFKKKFSFPCQYINWDKINSLPKVDAVFHLAGDPIASSRWTPAKKERILNSRINTVEKLYNTFDTYKNWPKVFISASAIGFYGNRQDEKLTETSSPGSGFLAEVCKKWEEASLKFASHSRSVQIRIGIVLDNDGGFLEPMEKLFSSGLGGKVSTGKQWMSWIHINDLINIFDRALNDTRLNGPLNAVAPNPVTNSEWTKCYANTLGVKAPFPAPAFVLKAALGEMSSLALNSQRVYSEKLKDFNFEYKRLKEALNNLYIWKANAHEQIFRSEQWIPKDQLSVFSFFSNAKNLEKVTPNSLNFKFLNQSADPISEGTLLDYKLKIHGIPIRWKTKIENWKPPYQFVDDQIKGPYKKWHHTHSFESLGTGTLMKDEVIFQIPFKKLGDLTTGRLVKKDIKKIFNFRNQSIEKLVYENKL